MSQEESENCRYCLELLDCEKGDILDPCKCKSLVHKKCFIYWLKTRPLSRTRRNFFSYKDPINKCEICNEIYCKKVRKYVAQAFYERYPIINFYEDYEEETVRSIIRHSNARNNNDSRGNTCFFIWFGLFCSFFLLISVQMKSDEVQFNWNNNTINTTYY